jgi:hypothetical protein
MIRSWRNAATRKVWEGERPNQFRGLDFEAAIDLLLALNVATTLRDYDPPAEHRTSQAQRRSQTSVGDDRECALAHLFRV